MSTRDEKNNGGPAFPQHDLSGYGLGPAMSGVVDGDPYSGKYEVQGMTLRDWFAGQAISGMYAALAREMRTDERSLEMDALVAFKVADAMLKARAQ